MRRTDRQAWDRYMDVMEKASEHDRMDCRPVDLCIQCDIPMHPTSGGKRQCRQCGALQTCCDTV